MAWLWASKPAEVAPESIPASTSTPESPSIPPTAQPETPAHPDAEFHAAYPHLAPATSPSNASSSSSAEPATTSTTSSTPARTSEYPTTMSCRAAFDSAFYCSSLGGHFNSVYRYGELRSCSEHWADWRFCMGLKTHTKANKEALIQERYREKEEKVRSKPNSEYVWERREASERHLGAFKPDETA